MLVSNPWGGEAFKRVVVNNHSELKVRALCGDLVDLCHIVAVGNDHLESAGVDAVCNIFDRHHVRTWAEDCAKLHDSKN